MNLANSPALEAKVWVSVIASGRDGLGATGFNSTARRIKLGHERCEDSRDGLVCAGRCEA